MTDVDGQLMGHQMSLELVQRQLLSWANRYKGTIRRQSCRRTETVLSTSFAKTTTRRSPEHLSCPSVPVFAGQEKPLLLLQPPAKNFAKLRADVDERLAINRRSTSCWLSPPPPTENAEALQIIFPSSCSLALLLFVYLLSTRLAKPL